MRSRSLFRRLIQQIEIDISPLSVCLRFSDHNSQVSFNFFIISIPPLASTCVTSLIILNYFYIDSSSRYHIYCDYFITIRTIDRFNIIESIRRSI